MSDAYAVFTSADQAMLDYVASIAPDEMDYSDLYVAEDDE